MGERKVLNKYYPPDFDPSKIPRRRQPKNQQIKVRMMLPMSIRCSICGNYIYQGTKFNSYKEDAIGETYLGIQIFRFYFKCTKCSAEIAYKTDPKNSDYIVESGATRNFEPWRLEDEKKEKDKCKKDAEEIGNAMKSLENKTLDSKQEMDILAVLDEMKSMKSRQATVSVDAMLEVLKQTNEEKVRKLNEEDEALIRSVFKGTRERYIRRTDDEDLENLVWEQTSSSKRQKLHEEQLSNPLRKASFVGQGKASGATEDSKQTLKSRSIIVSVCKNTISNSTRSKPINGGQTVPETAEGNGNPLLSLCQYDSDEYDE